MTERGHGHEARKDRRLDPTGLLSVLDAVQSRVGYLRTSSPAPGEEGWWPCTALTTDRLAVDRLVSVLDDGLAPRATGDGVAAQVAGDGPAGRQVVASLFAQSYAFKVGAVSLAAYAIGLPWPPPTASHTTVRLQQGRATGLHLQPARLGDPGDATALAAALFDGHLRPFTAALREATTIGERLLRGNVAASCAAAFRAVEGAARDRGDGEERAAIRRRAEAFFDGAGWLHDTGRFERVEIDRRGGDLDVETPISRAVDGWFWTRTSCCLYYKVSSGATCDDCSLIPAAELAGRRRAELEGATR